MSNWQIMCQVFTYAIVSYKANRHCTSLHTALHYATLHCTALHFTALYCTALHCTALYCTALHCTALHCTALHYTALHCTTLHCTPVTPVQLALAFCVVDLKACCMLVSPCLVMAPGLQLVTCQGKSETTNMNIPPPEASRRKLEQSGVKRSASPNFWEFLVTVAYTSCSCSYMY